MQVRDLLLAQARKLKKEKKGQEQNASMLESLPTELCAEVLKSIPDLCTLSCLLRASPTYFRTYTPIQQEILAAIVSRRFPQGVAVDVIAACISVDFFHTYNTRKKEDVIAFLDRYRHARGSLSLNPFLTPSVRKRALLSIKNLRNIQEGLEVLADEYIRDLNESDYTRELYEDETRTISLSTEQWMRIVRGLCRRQVYTHVFYQPSTDDQPRRVPVPPAPNWDEYIELTEANGLFVATFPPWEQNEIWAVNLWFEDRTSRMLDAVTDPAIDTPKIIPDLYYGSYVFCNMCSHGPMFLARLLRENDLTKQHDIVYDECISYPWTQSEPDMEDCLMLTPPSKLLYPATQLVEVYRQDMGNRSSLSRLQMPALGWKECSHDLRDKFADIGFRIFGIGLGR